MRALLWVLLAGCTSSGPGADGDGGADDATPDRADAAFDASPDSPVDAARDAVTPDAADLQPDAGTLDADPPDAATPPACAVPIPFDVGAVYAQEIRVEVGESLEAAAASAEPGTRIVLAAGVHRGRVNLVEVQGTADAPIAIVGEPGAILDADGAGEVLHVTDPRFLVLQDLELRGSEQNGLNIDDGGSYETPAADVVLRRLHVHDVGTGGNNDCIKLSGLDRFFVLDSNVHDCRAGSAIDMVGCHDGLIAGNILHDLGGNSVIQNKGGTADIVIHGNTIRDASGRGINAGGSTGLGFFRPIDAPYEAARIRVLANLFERVGAESGAPIAFVGCDACVFAHNTVIEPRTWVARVLQETVGERFVPCRDGRFTDNVAVYRGSELRRTWNVGGNTAPETFQLRRNLWYDLEDAGAGVPAHGGGLPEEVGSISADPALDDGFAPGPGSPAIGLGGAPPPYPDFNGRCYGDPATAGAFTAP